MSFVYDKKQLPQVIGLGAVSAGLLGYFCVKMITPPPTQAATAHAAEAKASGADATSSAASGADADGTAAAGPPAPDALALLGAAAPSDAMRDPFSAPAMPASASTSAPVQVASAKIPAPSPIPRLPSFGQVSPLPVPSLTPPAPPWKVTGVIESDTSPGLCVAIFRSGDNRRYIRLGEMVDDTTRLIGIDQNGVTVSHGGRRIRMTLGGPPPPTPVSLPPIAATGSVVDPSAPQQSPQTQAPAEASPDAPPQISDAPPIAPTQSTPEMPSLPAATAPAASAPVQPAPQANPAVMPTF